MLYLILCQESNATPVSVTVDADQSAVLGHRIRTAYRPLASLLLQPTCYGVLVSRVSDLTS